VAVKITVIWPVTRCDLIEIQQLFGSACWIHLQARRYAQKLDTACSYDILVGLYQTTQCYAKKTAKFPLVSTLFRFPLLFGVSGKQGSIVGMVVVWTNEELRCDFWQG